MSCLAASWRIFADGVIAGFGGCKIASQRGLDRILLVAAIIAFVAGAVSLAAIRSKDFARAAPGGQEGPRK